MMRKPTKPRKPVKPTLIGVGAKLAKVQDLKFKVTDPTLSEILNKLPVDSRDLNKVRIVTSPGWSRRNYAKIVRVTVEPNSELLNLALKKAELMEWKEWKYSRAMKEINEA
jgi:hypothetical protein